MKRRYVELRYVVRRSEDKNWCVFDFGATEADKGSVVATYPSRRLARGHCQQLNMPPAPAPTQAVAHDKG